MELCKTQVSHSLDGSSLINLMNDNATEEWRNTAYSYFKNGFSVRTDKYRLTKYYRKELPELELYDHVKDPNETMNVASESLAIVNQLLPVLEEGNTGLYAK